MQDRNTHGLLTTKPPAQTYCGLPAEGHRVTTDPFGVTCSNCRRYMQLTSDENYGQVRGPGRPKKRSLFG